jgi:hypothetical protein
MRERTPDDFEHAKAVTHIIGLNMAYDGFIATTALAAGSVSRG